MQEFGMSIYGLLYGDYPGLHQRFLTSVVTRARAHNASFCVWCNQVGLATKTALHGLPFIVVHSAENVPKYKAMRMLFEMYPPRHPWIVWFDDDSYVERLDWFESTKRYVESRQHQNICYFGQPWFVHHLPGQWEFVKKMPWFRGRPPEMIKGKPGITFAQGAYWGLRDDMRRLLDWPPTGHGLSHNGGDTLLGEAIRQQGLPFHKFHYGVKINDAKRRGRSEAPAGSLNPGARR